MIDLIPAALDHQDDYQNIFSSAEVCALTDIPRMEGPQDARRFLEFSEEQRKKGSFLRYSLVHEGAIVGTLCLYAIAWQHRRASVGYAVARPFWNRGIMSVALEHLEALSKDQLGLNRLQATVLPQNKASQRVLEKRGFRPEGLLTQYEIWEGRGFVDLQMYGKIL